MDRPGWTVERSGDARAEHTAEWIRLTGEKNCSLKLGRLRSALSFIQNGELAHRRDHHKVDVMQILYDAQYWRDRVDKALIIADTLIDLRARETMLEIARARAARRVGAATR